MVLRGKQFQHGGTIVMGHGAGGRKMHRLIGDMFLRHFGSPALRAMADAGLVRLGSRRVAVTTDSFVVQPLFFPGGDIGRLAVCGTVNDLAVSGAVPRLLTVGFILREGLALESLDRVCRSLGATARAAGVQVVAGDTKVIERGPDSGLYINTTGVGVVPPGVRLSPGRVRPGDVVLVSGGIGEHEAAIAVARGQWGFRARLRSDCAALHPLTAAALRAGGVRLMRDPTRGGLATTLCEFADQTGLGFELDETAVPVSPGIRSVAALLGQDPLYMANEGKVVLIVEPARAKRVLAALRRHPLGRRAAAIGRVIGAPDGVWLRTALGSRRRLIMLEGEQLPRIC
jgi:hydrogenase expression/formation protein HypE